MTQEIKERNRAQLDKNGKRIFFIDGQKTSRENYENIMGPFKDDPEAAPEEIVEQCPFCGKDGTRIKFVNLRKIKLCEKDYQDKTTGEIVAALR